MLRLMQYGKSKYKKTGFSAHAEQWDENKKQTKRNYPNHVRVNHILSKKLNEIQEVIFDLEISTEVFNMDEVLSRLNGSGQRMSITDYWEKRIDDLTSVGRTGNARVYRESLKDFKKFQAKRNWCFEELNYARLKEYERFMLKKGNKINTAATKLRTLRAVYNSAIKEGHVHEKFYPYKNFKIKTERTRKRALSMNEIKRIEDFKSDNPQLNWARDLFMFSFYCMGMNFVDMANLKVSDIHQGRIQYKRSKTRVNYDIGIHSKLQVLIDRYSKGKKKDDYLLPINDNEEEYKAYRNDLSWFNKLLKRLGEHLGLSITLSSYVGRHSWATVAKRKGVPIAKISEALGHTTERTTQIYLDSFAKEDMDEVNELVVG